MTLKFTVTDNVVNCLMGKVPISQNPQFDDAYNNYANAFNKLSYEMEVAGIDIKLLRRVIDSAKRMESLGFIISYLWGYNDKRANMQLNGLP